MRTATCRQPSALMNASNPPLPVCMLNTHGNSTDPAITFITLKLVLADLECRNVTVEHCKIPVDDASEAGKLCTGLSAQPAVECKTRLEPFGSNVGGDFNCLKRILTVNHCLSVTCWYQCQYHTHRVGTGQRKVAQCPVHLLPLRHGCQSLQYTGPHRHLQYIIIAIAIPTLSHRHTIAIIKTMLMSWSLPQHYHIAATIATHSLSQLLSHHCHIAAIMNNQQLSHNCHIVVIVICYLAVPKHSITLPRA